MATTKKTPKRKRAPSKPKVKVQEIISPGAEDIKLPPDEVKIEIEDTVVNYEAPDLTDEEVEEVTVTVEEPFISKNVRLLPTNRRFANLINLYGNKWEISKDPFGNEGNILLENNTKGYKVLAKVKEEDILRRSKSIERPGVERAKKAKTFYRIDPETGTKWVLDPVTKKEINSETGEERSVTSSD